MATEKEESVKDVITAIRLERNNLRNGISFAQGKYNGSKAIAECLDRLANRLEQANKRERDYFAQLNTGNNSFYCTNTDCKLRQTVAELAKNPEADSMERIVRDAILSYQDLFAKAPNDDVERELQARAEFANAWLNSHGFESEKLSWSKEESPCL